MSNLTRQTQEPQGHPGPASLVALDEFNHVLIKNYVRDIHKDGNYQGCEWQMMLDFGNKTSCGLTI